MITFSISTVQPSIGDEGYPDLARRVSTGLPFGISVIILTIALGIAGAGRERMRSAGPKPGRRSSAHPPTTMRLRTATSFTAPARRTVANSRSGSLMISRFATTIAPPPTTTIYFSRGLKSPASTVPSGSRQVRTMRGISRYPHSPT